MPISGNPLPVTTGGSGQVEQRAAVPVYVVPGPAPIGGRARRVVQMTSGPVEGGQPIPVYDAGASALYTDEPALPVYVVSGALGGASAGVTNPATIAGVKVWWQASSIAQGDSTAVTTWTDSISSIAPTQATAGNKPTYRTIQGPNGTPAVSFDGGDWLAVSGVLGSALVSANEGHIFIVQKQTGTDAQNSTFGWNISTTNCINIHLTYDDVLYFDFGDKTASGAGGRLNVNQPSGWDDSWRLIQLIRTSGDVQSIRDQGSQLATASRSKTITTASTSAVTIGQDHGQAGAFFTGLITDILIYNVALSTTDRQKVEAYFNSLYNLF